MINAGFSESIEKLTDVPPLLNKYLKLLPYEFEERVDAILDIQDTDGKKVVCVKKTHLNFVKDCTSYVEEISTDGFVSSFETTANSIKSYKKEIGRTFVETTFGRTFKTGENLEFQNKWIYNDAFCNAEEYFFIEQTYPCHEFTIKIFFPKARPYKEFKCSEIIGHRLVKSNKVEAKIINDRPSLYLSISKDIILSKFRIDWTW